MIVFDKKICLVCSSGGHLFQLYSLKSFWSEYERSWVTFQKLDADYLLAEERVYYAFSATQRNIVNFMRNLVLAWKILRIERPDFIISTDAGVGIGKFFICTNPPWGFLRLFLFSNW